MVLYNTGGECLMSGMHCVLTLNRHTFSLKDYSFQLNLDSNYDTDLYIINLQIWYLTAQQELQGNTMRKKFSI